MLRVIQVQDPDSVGHLLHQPDIAEPGRYRSTPESGLRSWTSETRGSHRAWACGRDRGWTEYAADAHQCGLVPEKAHHTLEEFLGVGNQIISGKTRKLSPKWPCQRAIMRG